jgi:hypothetical protein
MRNNRIWTNGFLNQYCAQTPDLESMLLTRAEHRPCACGTLQAGRHTDRGCIRPAPRWRRSYVSPSYAVKPIPIERDKIGRLYVQAKFEAGLVLFPKGASFLRSSKPRSSKPNCWYFPQGIVSRNHPLSCAETSGIDAANRTSVAVHESTACFWVSDKVIAGIA